MLFNSYEFILVFLPIVLFGYFYLIKYNPTFSILWLVIVSLIFYGVWFPSNLIVLMSSILINWIISFYLLKLSLKKTILIIGIAFNLIYLSFFKYYDFFINSILMLNVPYEDNIILPLGISFFTFTQIAYLVDVYSGKASEYKVERYFLFVTYFPHLIAGPLIHHASMMPQFISKRFSNFNKYFFIQGLSIFIIGLSKKILIADNLAIYSNAVFGASSMGVQPDFIEAWVGALAFTFQLYFDFSGYSDMAIGLSLMFGVKLPINFNSPYKSGNIINFWKSWHMTLSSFLKHYLYIPLGGNRKSVINKYFNIFITMILGGLWHGASWTFVVWGGIHGIYIIINHIWLQYITKPFIYKSKYKSIYNFLMVPLTLFFVVIAWIFFRAEDFASAILVLKGCFGFGGLSLPGSFEILLESNNSNVLIDNFKITFNGVFINIPDLASLGSPLTVLFYLTLSIFIIWVMPNTQEFYSYREYKNYKRNKNIKVIFFRWKPNFIFAFIHALLFCYCFGNIEKISPFLYYQF